MSGKILKPIAIGAGIIAIGIATGGIGIAPGLAATSLTGAVGATLTTTALGGALLTAGASSIIAGASTALQKSPKAATISAIERLNASIDPSAPRKVALGATALGTDIRYIEPSGTNQEYIDYIVAVAAHAVHSVDQIWLEDVLAWSSTDGVTSKYAGYLTVQVRLEGSAANTIAINGGAKWGASRRLTGCAYLHIRVKRTGNSKKTESPFASAGLPTRMTVVGKGLKLYDPRRDSTVPGGSGPMRINDQSTWRFQTDDGATIGQNVALQALAYQIGWRINGKLSVGRGILAARIDLQSYITAANLCDETITRADGQTERRYQTGGVFSENDDPGGVLDALATASNSALRDASGRLSWDVRHNDLAVPIVALNDDDVLSGFTWDPVPRIEQTYNVVRGRYCDPSANSLYQLVDYPEVRIPSVDGIDRVMPLDLPLVDGVARAQRIAKQALQRQQYRGTFAADFGARAWNAQVGDVVTLTFSALGWVNKLFRITEQAIRIDGTCPMTLEEENAQIYAWDREDVAGVQAGAPNVYDPRNSPLILAVDDAALTADWPRILDSEGTKPEDNATNGAPAGSPVAGRDAAQVIADADALADESIDQLLRLNGYAETLDLRTLIEGQPMGLFAIQQRSAREEGDAFIQATIDILGAKSPDGSGFVLSGSNVKLSPTLSLAGFVESTRVSLDGLTADTDFVRQVLIDPSGANAKILLTSNVNGHVSGIYNTNDGSTGKFIIAADEFGIADPNGGQSFFPLYYADGLLKMTNVEIDTLAVGSVTITSIAAGAITGGAVTGYSAAVVDGSGSAPSSNMVDVVTLGFYALAACRVEMVYDAGLAYSGDADFGADIQVNFGASYAGVSAGAGNTTPSFGRGASVQLAGAAYHTFKFRWRGSAGVKLLSRARLSITPFYK